MKARSWFITVFLSVLSISCKKDIDVVAPDKDSYALTELEKGGNHPRIAVVSDIHFMHPSLLANGAVNGTAFQSYLDQDPKLLQYSPFVLQNVIMDLKRERPDILLVPGDLTKDGEMINHQSVANHLADLRAVGTLCVSGHRHRARALWHRWRDRRAVWVPVQNDVVHATGWHRRRSSGQPHGGGNQRTASAEITTRCCLCGSLITVALTS